MIAAGGHRVSGSPDHPSAVAVVVTRDRKDLLGQCLAALAVQERPLNRVVVVDNASSDGTSSMVRDDFGWAELLSQPVNLGGAGGFRQGMQRARSLGADWVWLLDDDVIVRPDSLAALLTATPGTGLPEPAVLASRVEWSDGRAHPMNRPILRVDDPAHAIACAEHRLAPLRTATFASLLVSASAIDRHGLPLAGYFIWADDIEYTARVLRREPGYYVPASVVEHRTRTAHNPVSDSGERFYYHVRNNLFMLRGSAWTQAEKPGLGWYLAGSILDYLRGNRLRWPSVRVVLTGLRDGLGPLPTA